VFKQGEQVRPLALSPDDLQAMISIALSQQADSLKRVVAESVRSKAALLERAKEQSEVELEHLRRRLNASERDKQAAQDGERAAREAAVMARTHTEEALQKISELKLEMQTRAQGEQEQRLQQQQEATRSTAHSEKALAGKMEAILELMQNLPSTLKDQAKLAKETSNAAPKKPDNESPSHTSPHFRRLVAEELATLKTAWGQELSRTNRALQVCVCVCMCVCVCVPICHHMNALD
jgi:Asp-tRNA(Asn)/Glu-tRNA(Gln) amidotransferase A subunit family amidase